MQIDGAMTASTSWTVALSVKIVQEGKYLTLEITSNECETWDLEELAFFPGAKLLLSPIIGLAYSVHPC